MIRLGRWVLRKADSMNWMVVRIAVKEKTGEEYEVMRSARYSGTIGYALEILRENLIADSDFSTLEELDRVISHANGDTGALWRIGGPLAGAKPLDTVDTFQMP